MLNTLKKIIIYLSSSLIFIFLTSSLSFSKIKITDLENTIHVLDVHGKRYILDKSIKIKTGDYLKTKNNPAILILRNKTKICLSDNSSLKIKNMQFDKERYKINLDFKKGNILLSVPKNSKNELNLIFSHYQINNLKDEVIISRQDRFELLNFNNKLKLNFKNKKNYNILPYSYAKIFKKENLVKIENATNISRYTTKFLQGCVNQIESLKEKKRDWNLQYGCVTQNGKFVCCNRYK